MIKVAYISPSLSNQYDEEVIVVEKETWEEITSQMEAILDNYYTDNGWSGEVNLKVRFENVTKKKVIRLVDGGRRTMTDTKTKPHGWVTKCYRDFVRLGCWFNVRPEKPKNPEEERECVPVCLVPPALIDELKEYLNEMSGIDFEDGGVARQLLNKLKEIRNEPTTKE